MKISKLYRSMVAGPVHGLGLALFAVMAVAGPLPEVDSRAFDSLTIDRQWQAPGQATVWIEPTEVEFDRQWSRDIKRTASRVPLSRDHREEIAREAAGWMQAALYDHIEAAGAWPAAGSPDSARLGLRSRVEALFLTTHDPLSTIARNETQVRSVGRARLVLELVDRDSGEVVMRVSDHRQAREYIDTRLASPALVRQEMTGMMRRFIDEALQHLR
ncbi:MAG: hypothetical protein LC637_09180 [Xanthomonadaceae bacterium]|nr:hypothetical protein [Xanthomonadaceae bacterium]